MPTSPTNNLISISPGTPAQDPWEQAKDAGQYHQESIVPIPCATCGDSRLGFVLKEPVWIKTRGLELSSGFQYTRLLFDLRIDPARWDEFSSDVKQASRLSRNDKAAIIATIAGFSILGLTGVGIVMGERVQRQRKLQRVITNREEGGVLAVVLESWNENYFAHFGVKVWVEMSEAALRDRAKRTGEHAPNIGRVDEDTSKKSFGKKARKKIEEARKYMVVVSPLGDNATVGGSSSESQKLPTSFGLIMDSPSNDLIDLSDNYSTHTMDTSVLEDPFADPQDHSTSRLFIDRV